MLTIESIVRDLFPEAKLRKGSHGDELTFLCPAHNEKTPSASVNLATGEWYCFGCGNGGGFADFLECAEHLSPEDAKKKAKRVKKGEKVKDEKDILNESELPTYGEWSHYRDQQGKEYARVHRCQYYKAVPFRAVGDALWEKRAPEKRWPYLVERIGEKMPILVVEGERCVRMAERLAAGNLAVVGWMGGTNAVKQTDWSPLAGRLVILWPDNDDVGRKAMQDLAQVLAHFGCTVYIIDVPKDKPEKWDVVLAEEEWGENACAFMQDFLNKRKRKFAANIFAPVDETEENKRHLESEFKTDTDSTQLNKTASGIRQALAIMGFQTRYNVRSETHEIRRVSPGTGNVWGIWYERIKVNEGWATMDDFIESHILDQIHVRFKTQGTGRPLYFKSQEWLRAFLAVQIERKVDDFYDWVTGLPAWDGTERIDDILENILGAYPHEATDAWIELIRHASRCLFLGPIQRTMEPGCELDETIVLLGPGGRGKTKFYHYVFPPEKTTWYVGPLDFADTRKEFIEMVGGAVVVEAGELMITGMHPRQRAKMKDFLTRQTDKIRAAYGRKATVTPRRFTIIANANVDRTGTLYYDGDNHRRFIVVDVEGCPRGATYAMEYLTTNREQLWAEALHWYRQGYRAKVPAHLQFWRAKAAKAHMERDEAYTERLRTLEDDIRRGLPETLYDPKEGLTLYQIAKQSRIIREDTPKEFDMPSQKRLSAALEREGWWSRRVAIGNRRPYRWFIPPDSPDPDTEPDDSAESRPD